MKIQNITFNYFNLITVAKTCEKVLRCLRLKVTTKVKVAKFSFLNEKSYNKTVIDFNFGRHKDLSTLKSDIHLAASVNYQFFGLINPSVYLIEVNNCILLFKVLSVL